MANVMISRNQNGGLMFYLAKKDLEERIDRIEFDRPERWGGTLELGDGSRYYIDPQAAPNLPITLRAKRLDAAE